MERDPMEMALSTDIVLDIVLGHLKVRDLLSCRLASKFWNKIASSILRKRSTMIMKISWEEDLMELQKRMEKSSDFPFAGLKLDQPWRLNSDDAMGFFQNYGSRFTSLCLDTELDIRLPYLAPFISHLSRLCILQVGQLYSYYALDSVARQEEDRVLDLSSVTTIRISSPCHGVDENNLCEVLAAASTSVRVECQWVTPGILGALRRAGRLQAVTFIKFDKDPRFGPVMDLMYAQRLLEMDGLLMESVSLTKLDFTASKHLTMSGLVNILISSRHTLKELHLDGQCPPEISWDNFPVLPELTSLSSRTGSDFWPGSLFRGEQGHKFPALKELKLSITDKGIVYGFTDGFFVVPSVTRIHLEGNIDEGGLKELAHIFPNVTEMRLDYRYYSGDGMSGLRNPFHIWGVREFKYLEKLKIWNFDVKRPSKNYINMDIFLTGIPGEICQNLRNSHPLNLINSPFNHILRVHPNILQLRNLRELVVCLRRGSRSKFRPEDTPFISIVSTWYALEMIPNLRAKFVYEDPSEPSRRDDLDIAELEAAFEHVQGYVQLEPFFY